MEWESDGKERRKRNYRPIGWCFWLKFGWLAKMPENRAHVLLHSMSTFLVFPPKKKLTHFVLVLFIILFSCFVFCWDFYFIFQFKLTECVKCLIFVVLSRATDVAPVDVVAIPHNHNQVVQFPVQKQEEFSQFERERGQEWEKIGSNTSHHSLYAAVDHCLWILHCTAHDYVWAIIWILFDFRHGHFGQKCMSVCFLLFYSNSIGKVLDDNLLYYFFRLFFRLCSVCLLIPRHSIQAIVSASVFFRFALHSNINNARKYQNVDMKTHNNNLSKFQIPNQYIVNKLWNTHIRCWQSN